MRIGILTGGGDVPGLNPCIKAVVNRVSQEGHEVVGIRRGWGGLLNSNPDDPESMERHFIELTPHAVRTVDRTGGTFLHTSRTHPGPPTFLTSSQIRCQVKGLTTSPRMHCASSRPSGSTP